MTRLRDAVDALITSRELAVGWWLGLAALAAGLGMAFVRRARRVEGPAPVAGLLLAAAFLAALAALGALPMPLAPDLLGAGLRLLVALVMVVGGWLLADFDRRWRGDGLGPVLVAVSAAGIYATVPDTEQALVALGVAVPLAALGWPLPLAALGRAGAFAATGVLLWVTATGGAGRASSVVGGVACLGLLAVEPLARRLQPGHRSVLEALPGGRWRVPAATAVHLGLVYLASRVAGLRPTVTQAALLAAAVLIGATLLALLAATRPPRGNRRRDMEVEAQP
jgi:hypothetical protein